MQQRELAAKLDMAIGSQKTFPWRTFGDSIVRQLDKIKMADDLMFCSTLVTRRMKVGTEEVHDVMTEKQRERAWQVLLEEGVVKPDPSAEFEYRLTADIWGYEPGIGKANTQRNEVISAPNDAAAKRAAEEAIGSLANYRWSAWKWNGRGWERNRTAVKFDASWMRVERLELPDKMGNRLGDRALLTLVIRIAMEEQEEYPLKKIAASVKCSPERVQEIRRQRYYPAIQEVVRNILNSEFGDVACEEIIACTGSMRECIFALVDAGLADGLVLELG